MVKFVLVGAAVLVIWLLNSAGAPWLKRHSVPQNACAQWSGDGLKLNRPFPRETGHAYLASIPQLLQQSDDMQHPRRSWAILCEDQKAIDLAHSDHDSIRTKGTGRYSLWSGALYFSTSDNSDPNENGRQYHLVFPPLWYRVIFAP